MEVQGWLSKWPAGGGEQGQHVEREGGCGWGWVLLKGGVDWEEARQAEHLGGGVGLGAEHLCGTQREGVHEKGPGERAV